jgi:hypothetical protein
VLRQMLTQHPERFDDAQGLELLFALSDRRREELETEANLLGRWLFQDSPKDFAQRLKGYWIAARKYGPP